MTAVMTTAIRAEGPMDATTIIENINATVSARYTLPAPVEAQSLLSDLCQACTEIFDYENVENAVSAGFPDVRRSGEIMHQSVDQLSAAALNGCHLCTIVYMNLDPAALRGFRRYLESTCGRSTPDGTGAQMSCGVAIITPIARDQARLSFRFVPNPEVATDPKGKSPLGDKATFMPYKNRNESRLTLRSDASSPIGRMEQELTVELILMNPAYAVEPGVRIISDKSVSTSSDDCFDVARQWIDDCAFNHMKCSANEGAGVIQKPTYLLDVTLRDSKGSPGVKLVDGEFLDPFTEYVTLSHCWGISQDLQAKRIRLHKKTLNPLRQGVASTSLPKTFAEAAAATLKLGYRYLWIDALCIMHDSEKAVLDEVAAMHRIYSEATINLCATSSKDDHTGLFYARNPKSIQPALVSVSEGFGIVSGPYKVLRSTTWDDLVDSSPIARRAWILQERALSKRTLHFTRNELLWECQQMCCSEVFPKGLPVTMKTMAEREQRNNRIGSPSVASSPSSEVSNPWAQLQIHKTPAFNKREHHQRTANWHSLVEMYSTLRQTYTSDKLLGIAGLARQYQARNRYRSDDYAVGLWKPTLPYHLLWRVAEQGVSKRPSKWRAPSWTWASIDGRISMPAPGAASKQTCLEIIDLELTHKYDDPLGMCESGCIRVRGFMGKGSIRRTQEYWGYSPITLVSTNRRIGEVKFENAWFDERLHKLSDEGSGIMIETLEVYLLPVIDVMDRVEGLILCATMKKGQFKRLGVFEISNGGGMGAMPTGAMNVMGGGVNGKSVVKGPVQENWDRFKSIMKGDSDMSNYEERLDHENAYWFASDYTYTISII